MGPGGRGSRRGPMAGGGRHQKGGRCHCPCGDQGPE
jgi:hypothetical protein